MRVRRKVLVAFSALQLFSFSSTAFAGDDKGYNVYAASGYNYCDASIMASYWGESVDEAKAHMGEKVTNQGKDAMEAILEDARVANMQKQEVTCSYFDGGYSYQDAEALAGFWGVSVTEAKNVISDKLTWGGKPAVDAVLEAAAQSMNVDESGEEEGVMAAYYEEGLNAFFNSDYSYCDAQWLSESWSQSTTEAKAYIGNKVAVGYSDMVDDVLDEVREKARKAGKTCDYWMDYSYDDAVILADVWGISISDTKARISDKLAWGGNTFIKQDLAEAKKSKPNDVKKKKAPKSVF